MKSHLLFFLLLLSGNWSLAQEGDELYTIYLVRHAEKQVSPGVRDPQLTTCGQQRAASLANFLGQVDLEVVYSTDYIRTKNTAAPTAEAKALKIESYNPGELDRLAQLLVERKQDALVVGHSNTTAVLAGLLAGEELGEFDEQIYDRIYQVVLYEDKARLHILQSSFECTE